MNKLFGWFRTEEKHTESGVAVPELDELEAEEDITKSRVSDNYLAEDIDVNTHLIEELSDASTPYVDEYRNTIVMELDKVEERLRAFNRGRSLNALMPGTEPESEKKFGKSLICAYNQLMEGEKDLVLRSYRNDDTDWPNDYNPDTLQDAIEYTTESTSLFQDIF